MNEKFHPSTIHQATIRRIEYIEITMQNQPVHTPSFSGYKKMLPSIVVLAALAACGGGSTGELTTATDLPTESTAKTNNPKAAGPAQNTSVVTEPTSPTAPSTTPEPSTPTSTSPPTDSTTAPTTDTSTGTSPPPTEPSAPTAPTAPVAVAKEAFSCATGAITCVEVAATSSQTQSSVPVTFGQPFKAKDWYPSSQGLTAKVDGVEIPLQADEIASHQDSSARFAVLSAQLNNMQSGQTRIINLYAAAKNSSNPTVPANPDWNIELEARVYDASGNVTGTLVALPQAQLKDEIAKNTSRRLHGSVASEYTVVTGFKNKTTGEVHPHLTARLHTRLHDGGNRIRTDVVLENTRTWTPNPANITYDLTIKRNGTVLHSQPKFTHYHHARWHKVVWTGGAEPAQRVRHHMPYFLSTRATWNYDLNLKVPETVLANEASRLISVRASQASLGPMGNVFLAPYFPGTGGRPEIGPIPRWTAQYLISQDDRIREVMLANADAAAAVPTHYRDEVTGQPVDVVTHPNITVRFGTSSPAVPKSSDTTIWSADTAHQGSFAYIPYLITGDAFYLDETIFWAAWNIAAVNPSYREGSKGLIKSNEVRAQAWALRSIGEAARALPDSHKLKSYFQARLVNNLNWYAEKYINSPTESSLGAIQHPDDPNETSPWQNDFMSIVFSQQAENLEPKASETLAWFSKFTVGRFMNDDNGFCAARAPGYYWFYRDSAGKLITTWKDLFARNYPTDVGTACSKLTIDGGYPTLSIGYAAYARGMLGATANAGVPNAKEGYDKWKAMTPLMDASLASDPTWAISPR
ncbi:hypothetical protein [Hydrogenophaga sp.]|uniref:hypothetical protein n=1 Tax=Hydrogenophaga sp. TaxID=1904254 RepID=UPI003F6A68DC